MSEGECKCLIVHGKRWHRTGCPETKPKHECKWEVVECSPSYRPVFYCRRCFEDAAKGIFPAPIAQGEALVYIPSASRP